MATNRIGWALTDYSFSIKSGSNGAYQVTVVVTNDDGSALPTYDGWTAALDLYAPFVSTPAITIAPSVVGDTLTKSFTFDLTFTPAMTQNINPVTLHGSIWMTNTANDSEFCPANISLMVESHDGNG